MGKSGSMIIPGILFCIAILALMSVLPGLDEDEENIREHINDAYVVTETMNKIKPRLKEQESRVKSLNKKVMDIMHSHTKDKSSSVKDNIDKAAETGKKP